MSGAAVLSGMAALHGGSGLVTVACPHCICSIVAGAHPSYMTLPLADASGQLSRDCLPALNSAVVQQTAVAIGPGLGRSPAITDVVQQVYAACPLPIVLDADGLNAFADHPERLKQRPDQAVRVLTPHLGEFSRISGRTPTEIAADPETLAAELARKYQLTVLLKGPGSVITDGRQVWRNPTGGPSLATAGTGDVLTGLIASLLGQGMSATDACRLAAYIHGRAGDIMAERYSDRFSTSLELISCLATAWEESDRKSVT